MATQIFISEHKGDDNNDGLTYETPVLTSHRAKEVASTVENPSYYVEGGDIYGRRIRAELGIGSILAG